MSAHGAALMGEVSGGMVAVSGWFYTVRTWQHKNHPPLSSFTLWSIIGLALLLTYKSSGAKDNIWPAVFGFVNPLIILAVGIGRKNIQLEWPTELEWGCFICVTLSLVLWWHMRQDPSLAQYALYVAIIADYGAGIPMMKFAREEPAEEGPLAWIIFAVGFALAVFAVPSASVANYSLPTSSFILGMIIAWPLCQYRWRERRPAREWL